MKLRALKSVSVVVVPDHGRRSGAWTDEQWDNRRRYDARDLLQKARQHLGDLAENFRVVEEVAETCSFCKRPWEEEPDGSGQPVCCNDAVSEFMANLKKPPA